MSVLYPYVDPYLRKELWADPPRILSPAAIADQERARQQKIRSEARRAMLKNMKVC